MTGPDNLTPAERAAKLKSIITRVQNLIARADRDSTPAPEAALAREHAERLMREWRLEEENALAIDPFAITPVIHRLFVGQSGNDLIWELISMAVLVGEHAECLSAIDYDATGDPRGYYITYVGFEVDIRLAEYILSAARITFGQHLEPTRDESLSEQENVYRMRRAGMLRKDIAMLMWGENTPSLRTKAQRLYIRECNARGETPQLEGLGTDAKTFRQSYARGFVERLGRRLREARDAADRQGGVVVLAGRAEKVREAFYEAFPDRRPKPKDEVATTDPTPVKERKYRGPTKADRRRAERMYYSDAALAGESEGTRAANDVDIRRQDPTKRIEGSNE